MLRDALRLLHSVPECDDLQTWRDWQTRRDAFFKRIANAPETFCESCHIRIDWCKCDRTSDAATPGPCVHFAQAADGTCFDCGAVVTTACDHRYGAVIGGQWTCCGEATPGA